MTDLIAKCLQFSAKICRRACMYLYRPLFKDCGKKVIFFPTNSTFSYETISIGNKVFIGERASFLATLSYINIGNNVLFGPNVTIRGGNHSSHIVGKFLYDYKTSDKQPEDDQPVIIEDDVWIGTNVTILKGVTVSRGCIIAAGAVVTQTTAPYSIYAGVPAKLIKNRWSIEKIMEHEKFLYPVEERYGYENLKALMNKNSNRE